MTTIILGGLCIMKRNTFIFIFSFFLLFILVSCSKNYEIAPENLMYQPHIKTVNVKIPKIDPITHEKITKQDIINSLESIHLSRYPKSRFYSTGLGSEYKGVKNFIEGNNLVISYEHAYLLNNKKDITRIKAYIPFSIQEKNSYWLITFKCPNKLIAEKGKHMGMDILPPISFDKIKRDLDYICQKLKNLRIKRKLSLTENIYLELPLSEIKERIKKFHLDFGGTQPVYWYEVKNGEKYEFLNGFIKYGNEKVYITYKLKPKKLGYLVEFSIEKDYEIYGRLPKLNQKDLQDIKNKLIKYINNH